MTMIQIQNLSFAYGDRDIIRWEGAYQIGEGDRIGIVGRNGSGKTTLLKLLCGAITPDIGHVRIRADFALIRQHEDEEERPASLPAESYREGTASRWLGVLGTEEARSGGERMRARIASELAKKSPLLVADEPTSHLDLDGILQLQGELQAYRGAVILISHDRDLLDAVCTSILEVEDGKVLEYRGNYTDYCEQKGLALLNAEREYTRYRAEKARLEEAARHKAEQASRIKDKPKRMSDKEASLGIDKVQRARSKVVSASHAIESRLEQLEVKERPYMPAPVVFDIRAHIPINGKTVLRAENLTHTTANGKLLFRGLSFALTPGMKVALLGPNGTGKTTLLTQLFEGGEGIVKAPACAIGMLRQQLEQLNAEDTIVQTEAREQIESTLTGYPGTIVFATHDRRLARSAASHTLELRDGSARFAEGKPFDS